jgi:hypothetical protein
MAALKSIGRRHRSAVKNSIERRFAAIINVAAAAKYRAWRGERQHRGAASAAATWWRIFSQRITYSSRGGISGSSGSQRKPAASKSQRNGCNGAQRRFMASASAERKHLPA